MSTTMHSTKVIVVKHVYNAGGRGRGQGQGVGCCGGGGVTYLYTMYELELELGRNNSQEHDIPQTRTIHY